MCKPVAIGQLSQLTWGLASTCFLHGLHGRIDLALGFLNIGSSRTFAYLRPLDRKRHSVSFKVPSIPKSGATPSRLDFRGIERIPGPYWVGTDLSHGAITCLHNPALTWKLELRGRAGLPSGALRLSAKVVNLRHLQQSKVFAAWKLATTLWFFSVHAVIGGTSGCQQSAGF